MSSIIHFCPLEKVHGSKTLRLTLQDLVLPDSVGEEQDVSHECHGQTLGVV